MLCGQMNPHIHQERYSKMVLTGMEV